MKETFAPVLMFDLPSRTWNIALAVTRGDVGVPSANGVNIVSFQEPTRGAAILKLVAFLKRHRFKGTLTITEEHPI